MSQPNDMKAIQSVVRHVSVGDYDDAIDRDIRSQVLTESARAAGVVPYDKEDDLQGDDLSGQFKP